MLDWYVPLYEPPHTPKRLLTDSAPSFVLPATVDSDGVTVIIDLVNEDLR
jgi:hypothetical protein